MRLTLSILRCPDRVAPETRRFEGGEVVIGRGPGADWVLTDTAAKPLLSRRHCTLAFRSGAWTVTDTSTNGTTLNGAPAPEGQPTRALRDGDRLGIGPYEIEVSLAAEQQMSSGFGGGSDWITPAGSSASPFGGSPVGGSQPFGAAQGFAAIPEQHPSVAMEPFAGPSIVLPEDFGADLLSPTPQRPPAQPDHTPSFSDVLQPPQARTLLPSSWDDEPLMAPPAAPSLPPPDPFAAIAVLPPAPAQVASSIPALDPFAQATVSPFLEASRPEAAAPDPRPDSLPAESFVAPPHIGRAPVVTDAAPEDAGTLAAFFAGTGLEDAKPAKPLQAMREAGAAFRAFVHGLRRVLIARAEVKSAFRIDQTMVRSRGNNPLKFAVSDDDALAALLGAGRRSDMGAADAVEGALNDIRLHELATMAAMQEAMTELLGKLDPAQFLAAAEGGFLPAQKRARAYDLYEAEFKKLREAFTEKFDDAFGRAFARAYERVIADLQAREPLH
jgi:type VI secretion system FHA domain protein